MTLPVQVATAYSPSLVTSDTTAPSTVIRQLIAPSPAFCAVMVGMKPWDASNSVRQGSCTGDLGSTRPGRAALNATNPANGGPRSSYRTCALVAGGGAGSACPGADCFATGAGRKGRALLSR